MLRLFIIVLCFALSRPPAQCQTYTQEQGLAIARKLRELRLLSERGATTLTERIQHTGEEDQPMPGHPEAWRNPGLLRNGRANPNTGAMPEYREISDATILGFVAEAFAGERRYRTGMEEAIAATRGLSEQYRNEPITRESNARQQAALDKALREAYPHFKGPGIEAAIQIEDSLPQHTGVVTYPSLGLGDQGEPGLIDASRSAIGKTRTRTLRDLRQAGLVAPEVYDEILTGIKNNTLPTEMDVAAKAAILMGFRADYARNKAQELQLAGRLVAAGVMSDGGYERLAASYRPYELKEKFGLLPYCKRALIVHTDSMPEAPQPFFESLFAAIRARLLPELHYSQLAAGIIEDTSGGRQPGGLIERKLQLQFIADSMHYQHTAFYDFIGGRQLPGPRHPVGPELTKAINQWMGDRAAPYRLYFANHPDSNWVYGKRQFALLLLTGAQYQAWQSTGEYFLFEEVHDTAFTPKGIAQLIRRYEGLGLFDHLSEAERAEGRVKAAAAEVTGYADLLACFAKTVVVFDWETGNLEHPYAMLLNALAAASRGAFRPTKVQDHFVQDLGKTKRTQFAFDFNNRHYSATLNMNGDWLDPDFLALAERALRENEVDGRWYYCLDNGQEGGYLFLNAQQYTALKKEQPALFPEH